MPCTAILENGRRRKNAKSDMDRDRYEKERQSEEIKQTTTTAKMIEKKG